MKFTIQRSPLLNAIAKAQSVVEKRNTVQILANILCSVQGNELSLSATDLEVGVNITVPLIPSSSNQDGRLTLSAKHFLDIVKELPEKPLEVTRKDNNWIEIICGKSRFNIVSLAAEEYPVLPNYTEKNYLDSNVSALKTMIDSTEFAVSLDTTRYHLNGVYFEHLERGIIRMVATDGHRLSFADSEVFKTLPEIKKGVIIPRKGLLEFRKLLDEAGDTVGLAFERGYIYVKLENSFMFIRLLEGEYPDYRQVIPRVTDKKVVLERSGLIAALKRVSLLAHEKSRGVKLSIATGMITVSSSNPDMGEAREEIDAQFEGELTEIGFNARYLLDCLSVMNSETLEFLFKDRLSPGIIRATDRPNHTYVIMPMRL